jgi:hypothetical protein
MTTNGDVVQFEFDISNEWYELPLLPGTGEAWAHALAAQLLPNDARVAEMLEFQLARVQANVNTMDIPDLTAAVWIPSPGSGFVSSVMGFHLADLFDGDTPERYLEDFESDKGREDDSTWFEVETWRGDVPAGTFVAARNLISHPDDERIQSWIEERTIFAVFPPGVRQCVQVFFSAESIGSFWDMPAQTQAVVTTLRVQLGQAA